MDFRDHRSQCRSNVWIRVPVEADVAVTDLYEPQSAGPDPRACRPTARRVLNRHAFQDAARHGPDRASTDPRHALQEPATILFRLVVLVLHKHSLLINPISPTTVERTRLPTRASHPDDR